MAHFESLFLAQQWGLFIVRAILGLTFTLHGSQKVFGIFGGSGLYNFAQWMNALGVSSIVAYMAAYAELVGGLMLLIGFATEIGIFLTGSVMVGAIFLVHGLSQYFVQNNGFEYPFVLLVLLCALLIGGPGKFASFDIAKPWRTHLFTF